MTHRLLIWLFLPLLLSCAVKPSAYFSVPATPFVAPATVAFENPGASPDRVYRWDFGDGDSSHLAQPEHRYFSSGNYTVTLTTVKNGVTATATRRIQILAPVKCLVTIETDFGIMVAELYDATPQHRDNFLKLAAKGYYNGTIFHRVIPGFMIQGGDPGSKNAKPGQMLGGGGPGYLVPAEINPDFVHVKGALAAARTNNPEKKSSGSQFYIVQGSPVTVEALRQIESGRDFHYTPDQVAEYLALGGAPQLDQEYTVFGRVIEGLDVLDRIAAAPVGEADRPLKDVKMKITVID